MMFSDLGPYIIALLFYLSIPFSSFTDRLWNNSVMYKDFKDLF